MRTGRRRDIAACPGFPSVSLPHSLTKPCVPHPTTGIVLEAVPSAPTDGAQIVDTIGWFSTANPSVAERSGEDLSTERSTERVDRWIRCSEDTDPSTRVSPLGPSILKEQKNASKAPLCLLFFSQRQHTSHNQRVLIDVPYWTRGIIPRWTNSEPSFHTIQMDKRNASSTFQNYRLGLGFLEADQAIHVF